MTLFSPRLRIVVSGLEPLNQDTKRSVVVISDAPHASGRIAKVLRPLEAPVVTHDNVPVALARGQANAPGLIIYQPKDLTDPLVLQRAQQLAQLAPLILLFGTAEYRWFQDVLAELPQRHSGAAFIGSWSEHELFLTARKILYNDVFGVEKYLSWGSVIHTHQATRSSEKKRILSALAGYLEQCLFSKQLKMRTMTVADEYLMNAMYDAPVDGSGNPLHAKSARTEDFDLGMTRGVTFQYGADGHNIVLGCRDLYGSFDVQRGMRSLARCLKNDQDQIVQGPGGAGLGLYVTYHYVDHLVINLQPGRSTELVAVIGAGAHTMQQGKSVNLFVVPTA